MATPIDLFLPNRRQACNEREREIGILLCYRLGFHRGSLTLPYTLMGQAAVACLRRLAPQVSQPGRPSPRLPGLHPVRKGGEGERESAVCPHSSSSRKQRTAERNPKSKHRRPLPEQPPPLPCPTPHRSIPHDKHLNPRRVPEIRGRKNWLHKRLPISPQAAAFALALQSL